MEIKKAVTVNSALSAIGRKTSMNIVENILKIAKEHNLNNQQMCKLLDTNPNKIYDWKIGKSKPSAEDLYILADYFDCSVDYLLGRSDEPLTKREQLLLEIMKELDEDKQKIIFETAKSMLGNHTKKPPQA